jgi:dTDP-4-amino-4,6-dideoxygalactose transaminase
MPSDTHLPLTEYVGSREVTLPLFPSMTEEQVEYVVGAIKDYLSKH